MFCSKCGTENANESKFCKGCGQSLTGEATPVAAPQLKVAGNSFVDFLKKIPPIAYAIAAGSIVILIALMVIISNVTHTINLDKYVTVETEGYDGYGRARVSMNWGEIYSNYYDKVYFKGQAKKEYGDEIDYMSPLDVIRDYVEVELSKNEYLSNDEEIEYTWTVDEKLFDLVKCKLKYKGDTIKVSDLKMAGTFDAFADLEVTFTGNSPFGYLEYKYTGDELNYYDFSCDKSNELVNGDIVTIKINRTDIEYMVETIGMLPRKMENTYEVSGLPEYITSYDKISADFINGLKSEMEDKVYASVANSFSSTTSVSDVKYAGYIFEVAKNLQYYSEVNRLFVIYSGVISDSNGKFETQTVYFPVRFTNVMNVNGEFKYDKASGVLGNSRLSNNSSYVAGYTNPLQLYIDMTKEVTENYDIESGDGFEIYEGYEPITSLSDISSAFQSHLESNALRVVNQYVSENYNGGSTASDIKFLGGYLLVPKENDYRFTSELTYYAVCSALVTNANNDFEPTTVYYPVQYRGLIKLTNGESVFLAENGIMGYSNFPNNWWYSTKGYVSGEEMFLKLITANREYCTYEVSSGLTEFGQ